MKKITLTQGKEAIVDNEDYFLLSKYNWCFNKSGGYAERRSNGRIIRMHTDIINTPAGMMIDHINRNGLDNRKVNLRVCTKSQNMMNRGKTSVNKSGFKGVYLETFTGKWKAQIRMGGKNINLGRFLSAEDAARAYDKAAKIYHGEFACTNYGD